MAILIGLALMALVMLGPSLLVRWALSRHSAQRPDLPGTGAELAEHLVRQAGLEAVTVERTQSMGDHYDGQARAIRLSPQHFDGRSVAAAAVAAHEFGHALQHAEAWGPYKMRQVAARAAMGLGYAAQAAVIIGAVAGMSTLSPHLAIGGLAIGLLATLGAALLQIVTLPVEIDASFRRALPILAGEGYLAPKDLPAAKQVLTACAATYVAATLISTLNVFRWLRFAR